MDALIEIFIIIIIASLQDSCAEENKMVTEEKRPSGTLRRTEEKR